MSDRITEKHLRGMVTRINRLTGSPQEPYTPQPDFKPNALCYHLDYAYGGVSLVRMCKTGSGVTAISNIGFVPKRRLYEWMCAYIDGLEVAV